MDQAACVTQTVLEEWWLVLHWRTWTVQFRFIMAEKETCQPCQIVPCLGDFLSISFKTSLFLVQSRLLNKHSGHIPNQTFFFLCQNKLFLQIQILMLFLNILYETFLQFLCNVKVTIALCFRRWLILNDDEHIFYTTLNYLLGRFWGLAYVYEVPLFLNNNRKT